MLARPAPEGDKRAPIAAEEKQPHPFDSSPLEIG